MQPLKVWVIIVCKLEIMQELTCFNAFLYHYIDSSIFLEVVRIGRAISPKSTTN